MNQTPLTEDALLKLRRIQRLSHRPPNPGFAYRHLEHIQALCDSLLNELDPAVKTTPAAPPAAIVKKLTPVLNASVSESA